MRRQLRVLARALSTVLVAALLLGVLGTAPTAGAEEPFDPDGGVFTLLGHGFGHGKGMSQFGANQQGLEGRSASQILDFYYPGTGVGGADGEVRVRLDAAIGPIVEFLPANGLVVVDLGGGPHVSLPGGERYRIRLDAQVRQVVEGLSGGIWQTLYTLNGAGRIQAGEAFKIAKGDPVGGGDILVRGVVSTLAVSNGGGGFTLWPVNQLALEHYLYGVVPSEMPSSWPAASLQAQAVAARTYVSRVKPIHALYDICSTTACQVYRGLTSEKATSSAAVDATVGQIRTYNGTPAFTQYSSSNGGWIAPGTVPYQVAKQDPYDSGSASNPNKNWTLDVTVARLQELFPEVGAVQRLIVVTRDGAGDFGGRVTQIRVQGSTTSTTVSGETFRSRLGLKSTYFTIRPTSPILTKWNQLGGPSSVVGNAINEEYDVPHGRARNFERGLIYFTPAAGAHEVHGGIMERFLGLGATQGVLRFPTTDEFSVPGGAANNFEQGAIYWGPGPGARPIYGDIFKRFHALGGATYLGLPGSDEGFTTGGARRQQFAKGAIYWTGAVGARSVFGGINELYTALGGPGSGLGMPTADEAAIATGRFSQFERGRIYWSAATGAHPSYGAILTRLDQLGGVGALGFPKHAEVDAKPPGSRFQIFERAYIYWSGGTGARAVRGGILDRYLTENAANGALGLPVGEEFAIAGGARQDFQGAAIVWTASNNTTSIVPR